MNVFEDLESNVRSYCRSFPAVFERAEGCHLIAADGRRYLDFWSGAGALNYGHNPPRLRRRLVEYLESGGILHSLDLATVAKREFLERFATLILAPRGLEYRIQFTGPTGTNAVEAALKLARKVTGRTSVVCFTNAYHGMSLGALAMTGSAAKRAGAGLPLHDAVRMPYDGYFGRELDTLDYLEAFLDDSSSGIDRPAAFIVETVQAEGGVKVASVPWLRRLQEIAHRSGALLIVDDIQTGCGRTGPFFSFEEAKILPDLVCLSKSISGCGLPMALVLIRPDLDIWKPGEHNGTFRGNNLAFVAGAEALTFWENGHLSAEVARKGDLVQQHLETLALRLPPGAAQVRGRGLLRGLDFRDPTIATRTAAVAFARGLVIETAGSADQVLKLMPPLIIPDADLLAGLDLLAASLDEVLASSPPEMVAAGPSRRTDGGARASSPGAGEAAAVTGPCLLLLAAATRSDLVQLSEQLAEDLATQPESHWADLAFTLQTADPTGAERLALVADSIAAARHLLSSGDPSRVVTATLEPGSRPPLLLMFPGIGEHYAGMAQELYRTDATFRETLDRCLEMLDGQVGHDVKILFHAAATPESGAGSAVGGFASQPDPFWSLRGAGQRPAPRPGAPDLSSTLYAQPLVFAVEYALGKTLLTWGIEPAAMIGYSLGEYVAACLAGVFSLEDAMAIVARRASLIASLPRGAMLAVPMSEEELAPWLEPETSLAALNGPAQSVVAGPPEAIQRLAARLHAGAVATLPLATSHAFHSPSMLPIADSLARLMQGVKLRAPVIPYISNVTGGWITPGQARSAEYWAEQLVSPVRFADGVQSLFDRHPAGCLFLEVGPGQSLGSLVAQLGSDQGRPPVVLPTLPHAHDRQGDMSLLLRTLGRLWVEGVEIDWGRLHGPARHRLDLPVAPPRPNPGAERPAPRPWWARGAYVRPRTDAERLVAGLWHEVLRRGQVGACDSFFELGGDSFAAARLLALLGDRCGAKMTLRDFFAAPTVAEQAHAIERQLTAHLEGRLEREPVTAGTGSPPAAAAQPIHLHRLAAGIEVYCQSGTEAEFLYQDIFTRRIYCQHGIALMPGACVLDVGANIGLFSLFAHRECGGDLTLHAFEPAPALREIYRLNARLLAANFTLHDYGLAEASRSATLAFYPRSSGMSTFYPSRQEEREALRSLLANESRQTGLALAELRDREEDWLDLRCEQEDLECRLLPLCEVMRSEGIEHIDLLKIDVQKSELDVLLGIAVEDWRRIDQIVLEVHDAGGRLARVTELLRGRGFLVTTAQDEAFTGTTQYNVYARQPHAPRAA